MTLEGSLLASKIFLFCAANTPFKTVDCFLNEGKLSFQSVQRIEFLSEKHVCMQLSFGEKNIQCFNTNKEIVETGINSKDTILPVVSLQKQNSPEYCWVDSQKNEIKCLDGFQVAKQNSLFLQGSSKLAFRWGTYLCEKRKNRGSNNFRFAIAENSAEQLVCTSQNKPPIIFPAVALEAASSSILCYRQNSIVECYSKPNSSKLSESKASLVVRINTTQLPVSFEKSSEGKIFLCAETINKQAHCASESKLLAAEKKASESSFANLNSSPAFDWNEFERSSQSNLVKISTEASLSYRFFKNKLCYFSATENLRRGLTNSACFAISAENEIVEYGKKVRELLTAKDFESTVSNEELLSTLDRQFSRPWKKVIGNSIYVCAEKNENIGCILSKNKEFLTFKTSEVIQSISETKAEFKNFLTP